MRPQSSSQPDYSGFESPKRLQLPLKHDYFGLKGRTCQRPPMQPDFFGFGRHVKEPSLDEAAPWYIFTRLLALGLSRCRRRSPFRAAGGKKDCSGSARRRSRGGRSGSRRPLR